MTKIRKAIIWTSAILAVTGVTLAIAIPVAISAAMSADAPINEFVKFKRSTFNKIKNAETLWTKQSDIKIYNPVLPNYAVTFDNWNTFAFVTENHDEPQVINGYVNVFKTDIDSFVNAFNWSKHKTFDDYTSDANYNKIATKAANTFFYGKQFMVLKDGSIRFHDIFWKMSYFVSWSDPYYPYDNGYYQIELIGHVYLIF